MESYKAPNQDQQPNLISHHKKIHLSKDDAFSYKEIPFVIPLGIKKAGVKVSFQRNGGIPRVFFSLRDPEHYRGSQVSRMKNGTAICDLWVSETNASAGCIPGEIPAGEWRLLLDIRQIKGNAEIAMEIYYQNDGDDDSKLLSAFVDNRVINAKPGWYKGELHAHSTESDGTLTVDQLIMKAHKIGLDFLAISDHFTVSQWWKMGQADLPKIALFNSMEVTGVNGHANLHGLSTWVDPFVGMGARNINDIADETHQQGGLFCVNHALLSSVLGWRMFDMDWNKVDLMEIMHSMVGPNIPAQISLWDGMLRAGHRIIGVAGTDLHNPEKDVKQIGETVTWVYAQELSAAGILGGLKAGHAYMSKGPQLDFWAENMDGEKALMGSSSDARSNALNLFIKIKSDIPLRVMIIRDGFFLHTELLDNSMGQPEIIKFVDPHPRMGYYRIELHAIKDDPAYDEVDWRDFETLQALSNPIWIN